MNSNELISTENLSLAWGLFDFSRKPKLVLGAGNVLLLGRRMGEEESSKYIFIRISLFHWKSDI